VRLDPPARLQPGPWDERTVQKTYQREEELDDVHREVVAYITDMLDATVPHGVADEGRQQLRIAHEYESASDRLASVLRNFERLRAKRLALAPEQQEGLLELHDQVTEFLRDVSTAYAERRPLEPTVAHTTSTAVTRRVKQLQNDQLQRMVESTVDPVVSMTFTGLLTDYRRIRAHAYNIHEATSGIASATSKTGSRIDRRHPGARRGPVV
jgi:Na+/phosphate symporter